MTQWHPIFVHLLRPVLEDYYEIQTDVPVGDLPRQADIILLRRVSATPPPFQGLWANLSQWNVLEFKGRTESARVRHLDQLVEVGLGINRRFHEMGLCRKSDRAEVSFWYIANRLGKRFLRDASTILGGLEGVGPGLWRWRVLGHPIWLVSSGDVAFEWESLPVWLSSDALGADVVAVAEMMTSRPLWWKTFGTWVATLHPEFWTEIEAMATKRAKGDIDWPAVIKIMGHKGVKQMIDEIGTKQFIDEIGAKQVIDEIGVESLLAHLSPQQRQELKRRMKGEKE